MNQMFFNPVVPFRNHQFPFYNLYGFPDNYCRQFQKEAPNKVVSQNESSYKNDILEWLNTLSPQQRLKVFTIENQETIEYIIKMYHNDITQEPSNYALRKENQKNNGQSDKGLYLITSLEQKFLIRQRNDAQSNKWKTEQVLKKKKKKFQFQFQQELYKKLRVSNKEKLFDYMFFDIQCFSNLSDFITKLELVSDNYLFSETAKTQYYAHHKIYNVEDPVWFNPTSFQTAWYWIINNLEKSIAIQFTKYCEKKKRSKINITEEELIDDQEELLNIKYKKRKYTHKLKFSIKQIFNKWKSDLNNKIMEVQSQNENKDELSWYRHLQSMMIQNKNKQNYNEQGLDHQLNLYFEDCNGKKILDNVMTVNLSQTIDPSIYIQKIFLKEIDRCYREKNVNDLLMTEEVEKQKPKNKQKKNKKKKDNRDKDLFIDPLLTKSNESEYKGLNTFELKQRLEKQFTSRSQGTNLIKQIVKIDLYEETKKKRNILYSKNFIFQTPPNTPSENDGDGFMRRSEKKNQIQFQMQNDTTLQEFEMKEFNIYNPIDFKKDFNQMRENQQLNFGPFVASQENEIDQYESISNFWQKKILDPCLENCKQQIEFTKELKQKNKQQKKLQKKKAKSQQDSVKNKITSQTSLQKSEQNSETEIIDLGDSLNLQKNYFSNEVQSNVMSQEILVVSSQISNTVELNFRNSDQNLRNSDSINDHISAISKGQITNTTAPTSEEEIHKYQHQSLIHSNHFNNRIEVPVPKQKIYNCRNLYEENLTRSENYTHHKYKKKKYIIKSDSNLTLSRSNKFPQQKIEQCSDPKEINVPSIKQEIQEVVLNQSVKQMEDMSFQRPTIQINQQQQEIELIIVSEIQPQQIQQQTESIFDKNTQIIIANKQQQISISNKFQEEDTQTREEKQMHKSISQNSNETQQQSQNQFYEEAQLKALEKLDKDIREFSDKILNFNDQLLPFRMIIFNRIQYIVKNYFNPNIDIRLFGSCATGLALPHSDIDLGILGFEMIPKTQIHLPMTALYGVLKNMKWVVSANNILKSSIPVLKLEIDPTIPVDETYLQLGMFNYYPENPNIFNLTNQQILYLTQNYSDKAIFKVDITFNQSTNFSDNSEHLGQQTTMMVINWINKNWELQYLVIILKSFLKEKGLNQAYLGGLSSFSIIILVQAFLSLKKQYDNDEFKLARIFLDLLEFYGEKFDNSVNGIDLTSDQTNYFFDIIEGRNNTITIISPFTGKSISGSCQYFDQITKDFKKIRNDFDKMVQSFQHLMKNKRVRKSWREQYQNYCKNNFIETELSKIELIEYNIN